ncbi:MAG: tyrosine-type recombinase/integrase [Patescibacteria group bacterium]
MLSPLPLPIAKHINNFLDYLDVEKGLSKKTQENYSRFIKRFTDWLEQKKLTKLTPADITADLVSKYRLFLSRQTLSQQTKTELAKSTQNYYLIALRSMLSYFSEKEITSLAPDKIKLAKRPKNQSVHFLNVDNVRKLFDSVDVTNTSGLRDRAILEAIFSTGSRVSELTKLNREQLNFKNIKEVFELKITGKGNKTRTIYFSPRALEWLKKYLDSRIDLDPALFINFGNNDDSKRLTPRSIERIIKKYVKIAGLPIETTPHTLRHSFATDLLSRGVDLRLVQEFLGHESISTTQIYTHVTNKKLKDVFSKFHDK